MKITTLKEFQDKFNSILEPLNDKLNIINHELKEIENFIKFEENKHQRNKLDKFNLLTPKPVHIFEIRIHNSFGIQFAKAFNDYNLFEKTVKLEDVENSDSKDIINQAYEFVKYYKWLKVLIHELSAKPQQKKSSLTHAQKILALYYLGIDMSKFQNNVKSAKILASILDLDESNTKDYLTYFGGKKTKVKNKSNINKMIDLFEPQEFKDILKKVKEDL